MNMPQISHRFRESKVVELKSFTQIQDIQQHLSNHNYEFVAWLDYQICSGTYTHGQFHCPEFWEPNLEWVQRLRIFNELEELHIWRTRGQWKGRLRRDGEGSEIDIVVAKQILSGTESAVSGKFTRIFEERGTSLMLPIPDLFVDDMKKRAWVETHHYIDYNDLGQAGFVDCRFVKFGCEA